MLLFFLNEIIYILKVELILLSKIIVDLHRYGRKNPKDGIQIIKYENMYVVGEKLKLEYNPLRG